MELPPFVSKGSPIRAADQNKLIGAVRKLAAGSVARSGGAGMMRSRAVGKKRPFEVSVYYDAAKSSVVASVEPGVWHGNRKTVPAGIDQCRAETDTWIVGELDPETNVFGPKELTLSGAGYIVLVAKLSGGVVASVNLEFSDVAPGVNTESDAIRTVVAFVDYTLEDGALKNPFILQYLNGDFWLGEQGGDSAEHYAGNPFAWTRVGERVWQLQKAFVMVLPHQLLGVSKETDKQLDYFGCAGTWGFMSITDKSGSESVYQSRVPTRFWVQDGIAVQVGASVELTDTVFLIYAEVVGSGGSVSLSWRCGALNKSGGSEWSFPFLSQRMVAGYDFNVYLSGEWGSNQTLRFYRDAYADTIDAGSFRVAIPMAIVAANHLGAPSLVPIRHGMVEVRPTLAIGMKPGRGTEYDNRVIYEFNCGGSWCAGDIFCTCIRCNVPYRSSETATGVEALDLLDTQ